MKDLIIRINPSLPIAWADIDTLCVGFERVEARVLKPSAASQRFISLLRKGVLSTYVNPLARKVGLHAIELRALLDALEPVLERHPAGAEQPNRRASDPPLRVAILGEGRLADQLACTLATANMEAEILAGRQEAEGRRTSSVAPFSHDFALLIERYLAPSSRSEWLMHTDTPHAPIRLTDRGVWLGPLVLPGQTACLGCLELHTLQDNPTTAVLAAQVGTTPPASETQESVRAIAQHAVTIIEQSQRGSTELHGRRLRFEVTKGVLSLTPTADIVNLHSECGCSRQLLDKAA